MKRRIFSVALALCLCITSQTVTYAGQEDTLQPPPAEPSETAENEENTNLPSASESQEEDDKDGGASEESDNKKDDSEKSSVIPDETQKDTSELLEEDDNKKDENGEDTVIPDAVPGLSETPAEENAADPESDDGVAPVIQEISLQQEEVSAKRSVEKPPLPGTVDFSPTAVYAAMIAMKEKDGYGQGAPWTNTTPYPDANGKDYEWNGGLINGQIITAAGCVAFAFSLSDAAFGNTKPARMYAKGEFQFEDIRVGDILRMSNDSHTVIVLEVLGDGVIIAEGNYNGKVHWGRAITKQEVMDDTSHYITRYPEGLDPSDPDADKVIASGSFGEGLTWELTKACTLTISGAGAMPDYDSVSSPPWKDQKIRKVVIGDGVTSVGSNAFSECDVLSAVISSSVKTIGNDAFRGCPSLIQVSVSEGLETVGEKAFQSCASLESISLPASVSEVGAAAFFKCQSLKSAAFASGSRQVKMGDDIFAGCWYLESVTLPKNIDRIGARMFMSCQTLVRVEIPQGTESIGEGAFASCIRFTDVIIPDSVTMIGSAAFSDCALKDIYFTGTKEQWDNISKIGNTATAVSQMTIHYNYTPATGPDPDEGGNNDSNTGDNSVSRPEAGRPGNSSENNNPDENNSAESSSDENSPDRTEAVKAWKPTTPDEIKRYDCVGREPVRCILPEGNAYKVDIENAIQGPMCFRSFEAVLGDYKIGRTYNIYADTRTTYSTDQKVQITMQIPSAVYKKDREYKMICVTKGGLPVLLDDLDNNPETVTIETDKFHAFALIYR